MLGKPLYQGSHILWPTCLLSRERGGGGPSGSREEQLGWGFLGQRRDPVYFLMLSLPDLSLEAGKPWQPVNEVPP